MQRKEVHVPFTVSVMSRAWSPGKVGGSGVTCPSDDVDVTVLLCCRPCLDEGDGGGACVELALALLPRPTDCPKLVSEASIAAFNRTAECSSS